MSYLCNNEIHGSWNGAPGASPREVKQETKKLSTPLLDRDILRGAPVSSILWAASWILATNNSDVNCDDFYEQTKPMTKLYGFISHSWNDGRYAKWLALCLYFNLRIACLLSSFAASVSFVMQYYDVGFLPSYSFTDVTGQQNTNGIWCLIAGCFALFIGLAFGQWLQRPTYVFLDRACISQTDRARMRKGVDRLGDFLAMSERMIVLLTPDYFTRGWCTFELASFGADERKGFDRMDFEPLHKAAALISVFAASVLAAVSFHLCIYLGIMDAAMTFAPQPTIAGLSAFGLFVFCAPPGMVYGASVLQLDCILSGNQAMVDVLKNFDIENANFKLEEDKNYVLREAQRLWGDLQTFNGRVKEEVHRQVSVWASTQLVPYSTLVLGASPCLFWGLDMAARDPTLDLKMRDVLYGLTLTFLHVPLLFTVLGLMCQVRQNFGARFGSGRADMLSRLVLLLTALILGPLASMLTTGIMLAGSWRSISLLVTCLVLGVCTCIQNKAVVTSKRSQPESS